MGRSTISAYGTERPMYVCGLARTVRQLFMLILSIRYSMLCLFVSFIHRGGLVASFPSLCRFRCFC